MDKALRLILPFLLLVSARGQSTMRDIAVSPSTATFVCGSATGYTNSFTVTIGAQTGQSGDLSNWPMLFTGNSILKTTGNGGDSLSSGTDVVFCSANDGTGTILKYELVPNSYSATAGTGEWWIKVPAISHTITTKIYGLVGKTSATDFSCNTGGSLSCGTALFANCLTVLHMGYDNGSTDAQSMVDSCGNGTSPTNHSSTAFTNTAFPPVYEGSSFNSTWFDTGYVPGNAVHGSFSVEFWVSNRNSGSGISWLGNTQASFGGGFDAGLFNSGCASSGFCVYLQIFTTASLVDYNCVKQTTTNIGNGGGFHHVVASHTGGSAGLVNFWVDGVSQSVASCGGAGSPVDAANSTSTFQVGVGGSEFTANWSNGPNTLDEVRMNSAVRSGDQALFDFNNQSNPTGTYTVSQP